MTDFFSKMNADYAQKHFPDGSVFESAMKTVKRRSIGGIFFFALFFAAALCGLVWGIGRTLSFMSNGEDDMLSVGIVICGFFGVIVLVCLLVLTAIFRNSQQGLTGCFPMLRTRTGCLQETTFIWLTPPRPLCVWTV